MSIRDGGGIDGTQVVIGLLLLVTLFLICYALGLA
jgi:hypothetical protein